MVTDFSGQRANVGTGSTQKRSQTYPFLPLSQSVNQEFSGGQEINSPKLGSPFALLPPSPLPSPSMASVTTNEHRPAGVGRRLMHDDKGLPDYGAASSSATK